MAKKSVRDYGIMWSYADEYSEGEVEVTNAGVRIGVEGARWESYQCSLEEYLTQQVKPPQSTYRRMVARMMPEEASEIEQEVKRRIVNLGRQVPAIPLNVAETQPQKEWWEFWN